MAVSVHVDFDHIRLMIMHILKREDVEPSVAEHVANGLVHASLRGVDSHGIRLMQHYLNALKAGRINPQPKYQFVKSSAATGVLDADDTFGHAAGMEAVHRALLLAREAGIGAVSVKRSTHFGAASFFALEISKHHMIGMSFTHSDSLIVPTAGSRRFLGNNPVCFTAPCEGEEPICLDMATSGITFNKVLQLREEGRQAPPDVGADADGNETIDPHRIVTLLPVGGYKGYGLSLMVEILCALLSGMPFGPNIPRMYDAPIEVKRHLGHFFVAVRIDAFVPLEEFMRRMKELAEALRTEPRLTDEQPVQVMGDPEKRMEDLRKRTGIPLRDVDMVFYCRVAREYGFNFETL
jgi:ureidoglycolate dehydrogenase (NAD+)